MKTICLLLFAVSILSSRSVIIRTPNGDIRGFTSDGVDIYLGIRYGQFSERWTSASLPSPWTNTTNATEFGPICHQYGPYNQPSMYNESEQCLFINIWVPTTKNTSLLPVYVWLHGGGYTAGSGNDYDAQNLTRISQSIVVTINYRLGIFGFFPLPNVETRNLGWLDQQLALRWIQENIESFGGNKANVLLFGQSAGGSSSLAHILMPSSWPLYSSAIIQSAGPFTYPDCQQSEENNWNTLQTQFPECQSNLTCFRQLNASLFYQHSTINWITLWPCIGERSQLKEQPIPLIRKGEFNKQISIMGGVTFNEGQTIILTFNHFNMLMNISQYYSFSREYFFPDELIKLYDPTTTDKDYFTALTWLFNDYYIHCPTYFLFNQLSNWSSTIYAYFFQHPTENWAFTPFHFNATHLTEIPYVFHNNFAATQLTLGETNLSLKIIDYLRIFHLNKQPWLSYQINQTVILFDVTKDGKMQTQSGFSQRLNDKCPIILKYVDPDNCQAYLTEQECSKIKHCRWTGHDCVEISKSLFTHNK